MDERHFSIKDFLKPGEHFHFARKFLDQKKPGFRHGHDYYEVFLVSHGQVDHYLPKRIVRLSEGTLTFIRPSDSHALQSVGETPAEIINVGFPAHIADHLVARYTHELKGRFFWHDGKEPDTYQLSEPRFERAINVSNELQLSKRSLLAIEQYLLSLMTRVIEHTAAVSVAAPDWLLAASAAARRPEVFRQGAAGFVREACRGHEHVCRVARKYLGASPTEHVNKIRMEYAALMLAGSDLSISQIASECGIENLSYFYRVFQKQYGSTPRQYRLRHKKNPIRAH